MSRALSKYLPKERSQKSRSEKRSKVYGGIQMRFTCLGSFSHIRHTLGARLTSFGAQLWLTLSWCWKEKKEGLLHYQFPFQATTIMSQMDWEYHILQLLKRLHSTVLFNRECFHGRHLTKIPNFLSGIWQGRAAVFCILGVLIRKIAADTQWS